MVRALKSTTEDYLLEIAGDGAASVDCAIRIIVERLIDGVAALPIDLAVASKRTGIVRVVDEPLPIAGLLRKAPDGLEVVVADHICQSTTRRFTIAHEIGHAVFEAAKRQPRPGLDLEELCDSIAAEVLLPTAILCKHLIETVRATDVLAIAALFDAPLEIAARRIHKIKSGVTTFEFDGKKIRWGTGLMGKARLAALPESFRAFLAERRPDTGEREFYASTPEYSGIGHISWQRHADAELLVFRRAS